MTGMRFDALSAPSGLAQRDVLKFRTRQSLAGISNPDIREALIETLNGLYSPSMIDTYDVCVLTARKLVSLYLMLIEHGIPHLHVEVVSDRVLDSRPEVYWHGKRVLVIDDAISRGSTLASLVHRMRVLAGSEGSVDVKVVAEDSYLSKPSTVQYLKANPLVSVSSRVLDGFSIDVSRLLFKNAIPLFSDFLVTNSQKMEIRELSGLLTNDEWIVADVTSPLISDGRNGSFTFLARDLTRRRIAASLDYLYPDLSQSFSTYKVRSYVATTGLRSDAKFVPLALLRPLPVDQLDKILRSIFDRLPVVTYSHSWMQWTPPAKQRALQMLCSLFVLDRFWDNVKLNTSPNSLLKYKDISEVSILVNLGSEMLDLVKGFMSLLNKPEAPRIESHFSAIDAQFPRDVEGQDVAMQVEKSRRYTAQHAVPSQPVAGEVLLLGQTELLPIVAIYALLGQRLAALDEPSVDRTADMPADVFADGEAVRSRLGFNVDQLASLYSWSEEDPQWARDIASLALDICNDTGIAIPITRLDADTGIVSRYFKVGSNSFLGKPSTKVRGTLTEEKLVANIHTIAIQYQNLFNQRLDGESAEQLREVSRLVSKHLQPTE